MKDWRKTKLLSGLLFLSSAASAQSLDELVGSNLTLEESLVQFVNSLTSFQVGGAEEVLLYVVTPLIGFYYLILNFVTMAYENFQDEVDRPAWRNTDDSIPTGMRGFAMITSVITVLFLGTAGAGILLATGLISLILALLMFLGLFENENQGGNQQAPQQQQQQQQTPQQNQQPQNQTTWADALNAAANLFGTANNTFQNYQQQQQQQNANQLHESLKYFDSDFISELEAAHNNLPDADNYLQEAENAISNDKKACDKFRKILDRAETVEDELKDLISAASNEGAPSASPGSITYGSKPSTNLYDEFDSWYSTSNKRGPLFEVTKLKKQLERTVQDVPQSTMEDDFDKLLRVLKSSTFPAMYFIYNMPFDLDDVISDSDKRKTIIQAADNMNKHSSRGNINTDSSELQSALSYIRGDLNRFKDIINEAEEKSQGELKLDQSEVEQLSRLAKDNKRIQSHLEFLLKLLTDTGTAGPSPSHFSQSGNGKYDPSTVQPRIVNDLDGAYGKIQELQSEINSLEASIQSSGEHQTQFYQELEDLKSKIN